VIVQLEVLSKIVKRINLLFVASIITIPLSLLLLNMVISDTDLLAVLDVVIPLIFICLIAFFLLRYLYLSYSTIEQVTFQKPKYNGNYFILSLILPFLNIIVAPFYFVAMTKYYEYSKKDKITYICTLILYEIFSMINTLRIVYKNIDEIIFSENGILIFSIIEIVLVIITALVFVNTLFKNQKNKIRTVISDTGDIKATAE